MNGGDHVLFRDAAVRKEFFGSNVQRHGIIAHSLSAFVNAAGWRGMG
jgi:hypothetical protein